MTAAALVAAAALATLAIGLAAARSPATRLVIWCGGGAGALLVVVDRDGAAALAGPALIGYLLVSLAMWTALGYALRRRLGCSTAG